MQHTKLSNIAAFNMGQSPSSSFISENENGMPFLQGNADFGTIHPKAHSYCQRPLKVAEKGDILISVRAPVGALNKADQSYCIGRGLAAIRFVQALPNFGWHLLNYWAKDLNKTAQGSTFEAISKDNLENLSVFPPGFSPEKEEQCIISNILDTFDTQLQQTEQLIDKLKQIKLGLTNDLLTRGINENGDVRDPVAHPEQFKEAIFLQKRIKIPKKWETATLGSIVKQGGGLIQTGPFGSQLHAHEYISDGIPVIMPQDIQDYYITDDNIVRISLKKTEKLARHRVELNNVIFARRGDLSRCASISGTEVGWICGTGCLLVKPPKKIIYGPWLANVYKHEYSQRQILAHAVGSTMVNLNTKLLSNLLIVQPCYNEQVDIAIKIEAHNTCIAAEVSNLAKLKQLKKGLMHDLLTGCVRVTQLIAENE